MSNIVQIGGRFYVPQVETVFIVMAPILTNTRFSGRANAYCFRNAGNCDLILSNGFTMAPGQQQWFGDYSELNIMRVDTSIQFLPATATANPVVQRLEIIEVLASFTGSGFWVDQPPMEVKNTN